MKCYINKPKWFSILITCNKQLKGEKGDRGTDGRDGLPGLPAPSGGDRAEYIPVPGPPGPPGKYNNIVFILVFMRKNIQ